MLSSGAPLGPAGTDDPGNSAAQLRSFQPRVSQQRLQSIPSCPQVKHTIPDQTQQLLALFGLSLSFDRPAAASETSRGFIRPRKPKNVIGSTAAGPRLLLRRQAELAGRSRPQSWEDGEARHRPAVPGLREGSGAADPSWRFAGDRSGHVDPVEGPVCKKPALCIRCRGFLGRQRDPMTLCKQAALGWRQNTIFSVTLDY
uniref:Uncharacterized protein n=1 Tax=Sphaerodactylus townsendi TaxID=933632 RepID=A0ACB8GAX8_9SAUR